MKTQDLQKKADELFAIHSLKKLYITSDGQGFVEKQRAEGHAQTLTDDTVHSFLKETQKEKTKKSSVVSGQSAVGSPQLAVGSGQSPVNTEKENVQRDELVIQYQQLFGNKPNHNIGTEKLKSKIAEKQAEINKIEVETGEKPTTDESVGSIQ